MRRIIISLGLGLSLTGCASVSVKTETSTPTVSYDLPHYKRVNLLVADLERSLTIYQDILGFSAGNISESSTTSFSYPVFNIPTEARMRYTYLGEAGEDRVFGLTEVKNVALPKPSDLPHMSASVIGVSDLKGKIKKIEALGLETTDSKVAGGSEFTFIEQAFVDFDGHLIVLYEILGD